MEGEAAVAELIGIMCRRCGMKESGAINNLELNRPFAYSELQESIDIAIDALKKQIPKKPTQGEPYWWIDTVKVKGRNREVRKKSYSHKCPCCGKGVAKLSNIFCNHCGQKLDWSDTD